MRESAASANQLPVEARPKIAIIGGGISGIAAAYELAIRHPDIGFTLYESSGRLGGTVETVHADGFTIECGPDSWVTEKPWARLLAEELGLAGEMIPSNDHQRVTYIAKDRGLVPMPDGMRMMVPTRWEPLLHSPLLSWQARLAYLREPKRAEELKQASLDRRGADADESVAEFVLRHFGEEVMNTLAGPLLSGVFGGDIHKLSVRAVMAPFVKMEAEYGSLIQALQQRAASQTGAPEPAIFTSLRSGAQTLIDAMVARLPALSVALNTPVSAIARQDGRWLVTSVAQEQTIYDAILIATPAHATRVLLASLEDDRAAQAAALLPTEASSSVVVALGFEREKASRLRIPRGFGLLVPQSGKDMHGPALLACTFVDQKFSHRVPQGGILLRAFFGSDGAQSLAGRSDAALVSVTREQLSRLLGPLPEADVSVVRHWPRSLPQYFVGHGLRIARAEQLIAQLPGLHLAGNAYHGVGLPDLVREARKAADSMADLVRRGCEEPPVQDTQQTGVLDRLRGAGEVILHAIKG